MAGARAARLKAEMDARGDWPTRAGWIRRAVDTLPREDFAPERLWRWDGREYRAVDRVTDPDGWADLVYGGPDEAAVTQVTDGLPTSSLSAPAVVVDMLDSLLLEPGHRVLELGTGTGWNAALVAARTGPGTVTTVEADPGLAATAREALAAAGVDARIEVGDGTHGWPPAAPFDRVIATYAVEVVPWAWVAQTRPGGRIVAPWGRLGHVALTVAQDGLSASGWMQGLATFMPGRGTGRRGTATFTGIRGDGPAGSEREVKRPVRALRDDVELIFALRVALPEAVVTTGEDADGVNAWVHDGDTSWAAYSSLPGGRAVVHQGGPRRLADEIDEAWDRWEQWGGPGVYDHGMTVTPDEAFVWALHDTTGPRWPIHT